MVYINTFRLKLLLTKMTGVIHLEVDTSVHVHPQPTPTWLNFIPHQTASFISKT